MTIKKMETRMFAPTQDAMADYVEKMATETLNPKYRELYPGMGQAVAERTVLRKKGDNWETWGDVSQRVALGNTLLDNRGNVWDEYRRLQGHIAKASILMSGRHLQHGDVTQPTRNKEVFTNCSTAATSFLSFYLLLNGSGVGRCYDDDLIVCDWDNAPTLRVVLSHDHKDYNYSADESVRDAEHKYGKDSKNVMWFKVPDSREGWGQALEVWENAAFEKVHKDKMLILDFSNVRPRGALIGGMQDRPASGPVPLMNAFRKAASLKGSGLAPWKQAMYVDHYFSECVLVGGARRAARMSTKFWKDKDILDFIRIKRPIEFNKLSVEEVAEFRSNNPGIFGFLWSSNNSVCVDDEFWELLEIKRTDERFKDDDAKLARKIMKEIEGCSYGDGTGEPGLINVDKLKRNDSGWNELITHSFVGSKKYAIREDTELMLTKIARKAKKKTYNMIVNPCGEIALNVMGGYCVIADVVPYHCETLEDAEDAFRTATRALIRTNTMDCLYKAESVRTNRIGVGITGVHEFAWKFFQVGFKDLIKPDFEGLAAVDDPNTNWFGATGNRSPAIRAARFWKVLEKFRDVVIDEATKYSKELGVTVPHTMLTIKPAGTTSKLFGLTEGWHLPSMAFYLRWVQFRYDDPLVVKYLNAGYPVRELTTYEGTYIVGFPTAPVLAQIIEEQHLVTAGEATPEEQYTWLLLGEKHWLGDKYDNQISYTLKYDPAKVDLKHFSEMLRKYQRTIKCCSVMPQTNDSSYEYLPEEAITKAKFEEISHTIQKVLAEEVDKTHIDCDSGACPIDFKERLAA
jgi:adenosylcobalamin-dependent ribonucleoside-triphosphate reductase